MEIKRKLTSYTLSEIIVVLILTSIVTGMAFSVLRLVQNHMATIRYNYTHQTEINKLKQALWLDFNRYTDMEYKPIENKLWLKNELDSTFYAFHQKYIVSELDTFNIVVVDKSFFYLGNKTSTGVIDAIKITTSKAFQHQVIFAYKKPEANSYME
jgi:hypothetical protein